MTYRELSGLIPLIPASTRHFDALIVRDEEDYGERQREVELFAACYQDLAFRWHFVRSYVDNNLPLPNCVEDRYIKRLYNFFFSSKKDPQVTMAISLSKHMPVTFQTGLKSMLLDAKADFKTIASTLGIDAMAIILYEKFFFNIRDRMNEHALIASIPYPEGRLSVAIGSTPRNAHEELLRIGYNNGVQQAAFALGIRTKNSMEDQVNVTKKLEQLLMGNAYFLAQNGYLDTDVPGIRHAKQLLAAAKQGDSQDADTEEVGVSLIGESIAADLEQMALQQAIETEDVLKLQQHSEGT